MKTKAVRIHGVRDLRLDEVELPEIQNDEILAKVVSDSLCMSSYKLAQQGDKHKRVRAPLAAKPIIVGHEFCGDILQVGAKWQSRFKPGSRFAIQPALNYKGEPWAPGYSYPYIGGDSQYVVIPNEVMEMNCLLDYKAEAYYLGSLSEPMSCVVGAFNSQYHTTSGSYEHRMGIVEGGTLAIVAGTGPMGLGAIDYAIHADRRPKRVVVTGTNGERLARAAAVLTVEDARANGVDLRYVNTAAIPGGGGANGGVSRELVSAICAANDGKLFDDVFVFGPSEQLVELGDALLARDGCLNFFAGPSDTDFSAKVNFYKQHYEAHHFVANSGGNTDDIVQSLDLMARKRINPVVMVTHIGGLDAVADTTLNLDKIPGGKKLFYTHKKMDLVAISDFADRGKRDPFYAALADIVADHNMLWCKEAEDYVLEHAPEI